MISKIKSLEEYNELFINVIVNNSDFFFPLDTLVSDALQNDRISILREIYSSIQNNEHDYDHHVVQYNSQYSPLSESVYQTNSPHTSTRAFVYPFSKTLFIEKFYSNIFPSIINKVFLHMKETGRLITIGSGYGKCVICYPVPFTEEDLSSFSLYSYSDAVLASVEINALITNQQADINALIKQNIKLQEENQFLIAQYNEMQNARNQDYLTTWR